MHIHAASNLCPQLSSLLLSIRGRRAWSLWHGHCHQEGRHLHRQLPTVTQLSPLLTVNRKIRFESLLSLSLCTISSWKTFLHQTIWPLTLQELVLVLQDFVAVREDEISVFRGEKVQILASNQQGQSLVYRPANSDSPAAEGWVPRSVLNTHWRLHMNKHTLAAGSESGLLLVHTQTQWQHSKY